MSGTGERCLDDLHLRAWQVTQQAAQIAHLGERGLNQLDVGVRQYCELSGRDRRLRKRCETRGDERQRVLGLRPRDVRQVL